MVALRDKLDRKRFCMVARHGRQGPRSRPAQTGPDMPEQGQTGRPGRPRRAVRKFAGAAAATRGHNAGVTVTALTVRPLTRDDLPRLSRWLAEPHVAEWWRDPSDPASVAAAHLPCLDGTDPAEIFVIEAEGRAAGLIERYLVADDPAWDRAMRATGAVTGCAAGIDYLVGEPGLTGRGYATAAISLFTALTFRRYPQAGAIVAVPQQANVASWRALAQAATAAGGAASSNPATRPTRARPTSTACAAAGGRDRRGGRRNRRAGRFRTGRDDERLASGLVSRRNAASARGARRGRLLRRADGTVQRPGQRPRRAEEPAGRLIRDRDELTRPLLLLVTYFCARHLLR